MDADKAYREKTIQELHKNAPSKIEQILEATSYLPSQKPSKLDGQDMRDTAGEGRMNL